MMAFKSAKRLEGIGEYYFSQKLTEIAGLNAAGADIINLGIGSPDMAPHPDVVNELHRASQTAYAHGYQTYKGIPLLREAISRWYKKFYEVDLNSNDEILPLIGSKEGIMHVCMALLDPGDQVLVPNPGYPTYTAAVRVAGATAVEYNLTARTGYKPDWPEIQNQVNQQTKMIFVNYPHMPTGQTADPELFREIVDFAMLNNLIIVHDNPYSFILNDRPLSTLSIAGAKSRSIELNSLSKSHNMAGWRIGMAVGSSELIGLILRFKSNMDSGMFKPIQEAATRALSLDMDWFNHINQVYLNRKKIVCELLDILGCVYDRNQVGMFVWACIPKGYKDGFELSDFLLHEASVFITPGGIFGSNGLQYIRISLCTQEDRLKLAIDRIKTKLK